MSVKERNISLDIIRLLACMMVVLMHSPLPGDNANGIFLCSLSYFTAPCIGLFFMTSGALLLPIKGSTREFIKRRFLKIIWPTLIWTAVFLFLNYPKISFTDIFSIPFSCQGHGVMWFMYSLSGLYLLSPIVSRWLSIASNSEISFYLSIFLITTLFPYLQLFLIINTGHSGILYYFTGYVGYFVAGYYLNKAGCRKELIYITAALGILGASVILILKIIQLEFNFYNLFWYLSFPVVAMCIFWFGLLERCRKMFDSFNNKLKQSISTLSCLSFGIYLSHIAFMRYWIWNMPIINNINNYILQTLLIFIITLVSSVAFSYLIALLPIGKYIIGYQK